MAFTIMTDAGGPQPPQTPRRSGSHLGSPGHKGAAGPSRGTHFGHHKTRSGQTAGLQKRGKGKKARNKHFKAKGASKPHQPDSTTIQGASNMGASGMTTYFPDLASFFPQIVDIYGNPGTYPPVPGGASARTAGVNMLVTGVFPEGTRNRTAAGDSYTHVLICDPAIEVHDAYSGSSPSGTPYGDIICIPAGTKTNYWLAVFVYETALPGMGRKKIILADRRTSPGDWTKIV